MPKKGGVLQFGTEVVAAADGSIAGLLGASPGASTAVPIMLGLVEKCFPDRMDAWRPEAGRHGPDATGTSSPTTRSGRSSTMGETAKALEIAR